jgi:iron(III) transport system permease protein
VTPLRRALLVWLILGAVGFLMVPWYALQDTIVGIGWLSQFASKDNAPAVIQALSHGRSWLWPIGIIVAAGFLLLPAGVARRTRANTLIAIGAIGFLYLCAQGFIIGPRGVAFESLAGIIKVSGGQFGIGLGATLVGTSFAMLFALGLAERGYFKGDAFVAGSVVIVALLVVVFTFFPVLTILIQAVQNNDGAVSLQAFFTRLFTEKIWGIGCIVGNTRCGVAWNTLILAVLCAVFSTALGLAFALIVSRTRFPYKKVLRILSVLPIITPPFVIGLGLILIFGRSGLVNQFLEWAFQIQPTRWIYGLQGVLVAQVFAFTPIAFLVLIGVVEGVSPSMEEAAQTLRADRWRTFIDISLPLMRPGLANAFLISFIESIADFGNPIILGGNFVVLSTEIFFSVVGAQLDQGRAATLGIVLLMFALGAFFLQRRALGRKVTRAVGQGGFDADVALDAARRVRYGVVEALSPSSCHGAGAASETCGRDYTPTLKHYVKAFGVEWGPHGIIWAGAAWNSFWTTVKLSAIAAPLTAALGILTAYLLTRQKFVGQSTFEFGTMLSFAIPGTVIGVSYILAFNVPPIELTGTALILVVCNIFRNMPVGVRAGMASMVQIDKSLDEASITLGARGFTVLRTVLLPLLKPAVVAALVYSFVRAMTTVSAVIFLVSAEYEWATTYIINRVVNGDYGVAIAYSSVLIVMMLIAIWVIQKLSASVVSRRAAARR